MRRPTTNDGTMLNDFYSRWTVVALHWNKMNEVVLAHYSNCIPLSTIEIAISQRVQVRRRPRRRIRLRPLLPVDLRWRAPDDRLVRVYMWESWLQLSQVWKDKYEGDGWAMVDSSRANWNDSTKWAGGRLVAYKITSAGARRGSDLRTYTRVSAGPCRRLRASWQRVNI